MPRYIVTWQIDVEEDEITTPVEAARWAQAKQQTDREGYWMGVFTVRNDEGGETFEVDLDADPVEVHQQDGNGDFSIDGV